VTLDSQHSPQPKLERSHHLPPYSILYTSPRGPHPNSLFVPGLPKGSLETTKVRFPQLYRAITSFSDLQLGWGLKKSCNSHQELFNGVLHSICMHGSQVASQLFVVRSQTTNLTPDLYFCHNLCCKCPNGSWKPILDIYTSIAFQWYKELLNMRCFDVYNCSMKVWESTGTPTPKRRAHLGVSLHSHTLLGPCPWDPFALVASPRLSCNTIRRQIGNLKIIPTILNRHYPVQNFLTKKRIQLK